MEGWPIVLMGDLCSIQSGKSDTKDAVADGPYAFFDRSKTVKRSNRFLRDCEALIIPGEGTEFLPRHFIGKFDLHQRAYALFDFSPRLEVRYLYYFLHHVADYFPRVAVGATVKSLRLRHFQNLPVRLALPEEQRRLVAILDEAFEAIATAKANTEKNLQNAQALFAGHLQAVFSQQGAGWIKKTVQQWVSDGVLAKPQDGNHGEIHPTKADYVDEGVPFIMAADLIDGRVDTQGCRFIARAQAEALRIGFAKTGDVLLSHKGTIGRVAILKTNDDYVILTPQVTYYRSLNSDRVFNEFLYYCLLSPEFQAAMNRIAGAGSTRAYIGITRQLDLQISLPPVEVQRRTAAQLRRIEEDSGELSAIYETKLSALDELKKSLLHQAFTGQLTAKSTDQQLEAMA